MIAFLFATMLALTPQTWPFIGQPGTTAPAATPPPLIILAGTSAAPAGVGPDMGAAVPKLIWMEELAQETAGTNGCTSPCQLTKYTDLLQNPCNTVAEQASVSWALANDENAFLHIYGGGLVNSNRMLNGAAADACVNYPPSSGSEGPQGSDPYFFNPGDGTWDGWLYTNVWANTGTHYYPSGYGVWEDQSAIAGNFTCGIGSAGAIGQIPAGEYSIGWNGGATQPCNFVGAAGTTYDGGSSTWSSYVMPIDYQTAMATFINNACQATCLKAVINGYSPLASASASQKCNVIVSGHCNNQANSSIIDDQFNYDTFLGALTKGNLIGMEAEKEVLGQWTGSPGSSTYANSWQLTQFLNSVPRYYSDVNCAKTKLFDIEYGFGTGGPAVPADSTQIQARTLTTALHWLIPNPATQIPDCLMYHYLTLGSATGISGEAPYYFEETLVPWQPEQSVTKFVWNGVTQTVGGNCDSNSANTQGNHGDKGGVGALEVQCVNSGGNPTTNDGAGIYCQQYKHLYINGVDKGKAAACLDTSQSQNPTVASTWFTHDSWTNYNYTLNLPMGELTSLPLGGGTVNLASVCTDANCNAYPSAGAAASSWSYTSPGTICGSNTPPCGEVFLANPIP